MMSLLALHLSLPWEAEKHGQALGSGAQETYATRSVC